MPLFFICALYFPRLKTGSKVTVNYRLILLMYSVFEGGNKQMGKGSGIFHHIALYSGLGTAGCVEMKEAELVVF